MIAFFANLFGYILNFLYEFIGNYGFAIILFSVLVKVIMIPISVKQQKTLKKSQKMNEEMQQIQFRYKNDPEKMNQEVMDLYKREKLSPFSGCFSAIVQIILLFAVFYLVRSPLTYMKKVDPAVIEKLEEVVQQQGYTSNYKEIAVINYINNLEKRESESQVSVRQEENTAQKETGENTTESNENQEDTESNKDESNTMVNKENQEEFNINDYKDQVYINMDFFGLDLSKVPTENLDDITVFIIPALYVISSFISIRLSTNSSKKKKDKNLIGDGTTEEKNSEYDPMAEANKSMKWFMPLMSISIALIAPLGLALYWLINNMLMIFERIILEKFLKDDKEEAKNNA